MRQTYIVIFVLLVTGCARGFVKEGATYKDFYADMKACEQEATPKTPKWTVCVGAACNSQARQIQQKRNRCMQAKDWIIKRDPKAFH